MPLQLRGLQVRITCEDKELPQFRVEQDGDHSISCYIPSEAGKAFVIESTTCGFDQSDIRIFVSIDGRLAGNCETHLEFLEEGIIVEAKGKEDTSTMCPFIFAAVHTHEGEASSNDDLSQLGMVEIKFCRVEEYHGPRKHFKPCNLISGSFFPAELHVPETKNLTGYNYTILGEPVKATNRGLRFDFTEIDPANDPFCVFRFRYMPREMLQARGIIPRSAPLEPAHAENPSAQKNRKKEEKSRKRTQPSGSPPPAAARTSPVHIDNLNIQRRRSKRQAEKSSKRLRQASEPSSPEAGTTPIQVEAEVASETQVEAEVISVMQVEEEVASKMQVKAEISTEGDTGPSSTSLDARIQALEAEVEELKRKRAAGPLTSQRKVKRSLSPIRVGSFNGQIIDLTSD